MKLATTTCDYAHYYDDHKERLDALHRAGFRYVDLNMYTDVEMAPFMQDDWKDYTKALAACAEQLGLTFVQAHSPGGNPLGSAEERAKLIQTTRRSVEVCGMLGIPNTVSHAGWRTGIEREQYYEENLAFYREFFDVMDACGVNVLTENSTRANMGTAYYFYDGADMRDFLEYAGNPRLGACWDTGHANVEGHQYADLMALGSKHLKAVHINDNRGEKDEHILPFCGTMSIDEVMHGLLNCGYEGYFTLECGSTLRPSHYWLGDRRSFSGDCRLTDAPIEMKDKLEEAAFRFGKYVLTSYDCYEE